MGSSGSSSFDSTRVGTGVLGHRRQRSSGDLPMASAFKRFVPLADRILVQKLKADIKSAGGILLPESAKQEVNQAKVLAIGPGRRSPKGDILPMGTKVGDTVIIPRYGGSELKLGEDEYHIYKDEDIVGVIKDE